MDATGQMRRGGRLRGRSVEAECGSEVTPEWEQKQDVTSVRSMSRAQDSSAVLERHTAPLSVVIVSHDSVNVLGTTTQSVARLLPAAEIVVVENGVTERALDLVRLLGIGARTVRVQSNLGFGSGCNVGAATATREFILFLNPDAPVVDIDAAELGSSLARRPFGVLAATGISSCSLEPLTRRDRGWRAEITVELGRCFLTPSWIAQLPFEAAVTRGGPWASGAAMLVRRDEFLALGGFDERFFYTTRIWI